MKYRWQKVLSLLLILALLSSLYVILGRQADYQKGRQDYGEARQTAGVPAQLESWETEDPYTDASADFDLEALQAVNPEVTGWIVIPGTKISYPLLQGEDNSYYLNHTWKREHSGVGAIYLDCQCDKGMGDFNTIIYGHNMRDGSMFGSLKHYREQSCWEEHPVIYLITDQGVFSYDIFAVWEAGVQEAPYRLSFPEVRDRQAFLEVSRERSVVNTEIVPGTEDKILTLSTCTGRDYSTRWVVQAVKKRE